MSKLRLCIAGKNKIAVDVMLAAPTVTDARIACVPLSQDRGVDGWQPSLLNAARNHGIDVIDVDEAMSDPDLCFLSLEYDQIIDPRKFASQSLFNLHFSLLPKYRGCHTAIWPILYGESDHGVTIHEIDAGVDTGAIVAQRGFEIGDLTARDLYMKCMALGTDLVLEWIPHMLSGNYEAIPQNPHEGSSFRRRDLDFTLREIDFTQTSEISLRRIRAFTFVEYQLPVFRGREFLNAREVRTVSTAPPETVLEESDAHLVVKTADGTIRFDIRPGG